MARAKKLPSGSWRVQASKVVSGKKISKSFTVSPSDVGGDSRKAKQQAELLAREWQLSIEADEANGCTISQAMLDYIADREKVLSPRTILDYKAYLKYFEPIGQIYVADLKTRDIQALINEWAMSVSRKTITNRITFLLSCLDYADCDKKFKLQYPKSTAKKVQSPDLEDVQILLRNARDDFKIVIALAAFGTLRRGEISALCQKDVSRDMKTIFVHSDMVLTEEGYVVKEIPKTTDSVRTVRLPDFIMDMLPVRDNPEDFVIGLNPTQISSRYNRLRKKCGIDHSFHTLRHYAASYRSDLGIPSKYVEEAGGWKNSKVLKDVYDNPLNSSRKKYTAIANRFVEENFKDIMEKSS